MTLFAIISMKYVQHCKLNLLSSSELRDTETRMMYCVFEFKLMSLVLQFVVFLVGSLEPTLPATQQVVLYQGIKRFELEADT